MIRKLCGMSFIQDLIVLPFATGMSITFTLLTLKANNPQCEYVIWPRIDQKTCLKAITAANLKALVVEQVISGDELQTNTEGVK